MSVLLGSCRKGGRERLSFTLSELSGGAERAAMNDEGCALQIKGSSRCFQSKALLSRNTLFLPPVRRSQELVWSQEMQGGALSLLWFSMILIFSGWYKNYYEKKKVTFVLYA